MYTVKNYRSKKDLKADVANGVCVPISYADAYLRGIFPAKTDGTEVIEGPHYPEPHKWYAQALLRDGLVIMVK